MAHTILHIVLYIWVLTSAGFALVAKWSSTNIVIEILMKIMAIAAVVWAILDMLKIQY
jgi:hypothetical protein